MCLISFVIPLYNKEKYIERCLASVCRQKGDDIQIIVVDDGSTDRSRNIVRGLQEKDSRIEYFYQENQGEGEARNTGIRLARGKWIAFIDADDFISRSYMENARPNLDDGVDCLVIGSYIYKDDKVLRSSVNAERLQRDWRTGTIDFIKDYLGGKATGVGTSVWNKVFKRQIILEKKLLFLPLEIGADTRFCLEYAMNSCKWKGVPYNLYYYVQTGDSIMHSYSGESIKRINCLMDSYDEFGKKYGIYEEIRPAIGCINVVDIFTILKMVDRMESGGWKTCRAYRRLMRTDYYRNKISCIDTGAMSGRYRLVYYLFKYRMAMMMVALVKAYHLVYRL